ncbi:MAG TPA: SPOR domain-containing protein [Polyangiaceae bacterium]|jgi:cell division septation protein DedD|nr:SPOR domain-containing protein [Polyangiaceae bacterium]
MNVRNLEQIQEESGRGGLPFGTLLLSALAGGALVVAAMATFQRAEPPRQATQDPLAELIERSQQAPKATPLVVPEANVTFPRTLSDDGSPTTALAAVKDEQGRLLERVAPSIEAPKAGPADALPKAPLPAGDLLGATKVTTAPSDELGQLAKSVSDDQGELAPPGEQGGYEIQVASFQNPVEADAFVEELRKRGHRAYRQAAYVPDRGLWHRVRIGSFKYKVQALEYQKKLERDERISGFLVDPDQVKRQEAIRDAKMQARQDKQRRHPHSVLGEGSD